MDFIQLDMHVSEIFFMIFNCDGNDDKPSVLVLQVNESIIF